MISPSAFDPAEYSLRAIGRFRPRATRDIAASRIGVGFETLDRYHFDAERTYPRLAELGAKWARVQSGWNRCEREKGRYDFAWLDEVVDALLEVGVQPFFNLGFGNLLYTPDAPHDSARGYVAFYYGEEAATAWRRYVAALAENFSGRVTHWEVWNEPNARGFWRPEEPNPADYVRLLAETVPPVKEAIPDAIIVGGVCSAVRPTGPASYLEACFDLGMAEWIDVLAWHPYRAIPEHGYRSEVANLRRLIACYKPELDLWQGECGCQSKRGGLCEFMDMERLDETIQAKWVLRRIVTDLALDLDYTQYFHTVDLFDYIMHDGPSGMNQYMGLLRGEDYSPKPSFRALQVLCSLLDADTVQADFIVFPRKPKGVRYTRRYEIAAVQSASFLRGAYPLYAFWYPSDLGDQLGPQRIEVDVWQGSRGRLDNPCVIDPLSGQVYDLQTAEGQASTPAGGTYQLPLLDYPLFLTDRAVVDGMLEHDSREENGK